MVTRVDRRTSRTASFSWSAKVLALSGIRFIGSPARREPWGFYVDYRIQTPRRPTTTDTEEFYAIVVEQQRRQGRSNSIRPRTRGGLHWINLGRRRSRSALMIQPLGSSAPRFSCVARSFGARGA